MVYNGKPTREWLSREDSASPTAAFESIMLTAVIDAHEERNIMTCNIPNAFIQALMPEVKDRDERVMMKITGVLVDMLVELNPELYGPYVVYEKNGQNKVLYVQVMRAIYGMLEAAILWHNNLRGELEQKGFKFNPYDPCVADRTEKGSQHTLLFHVDGLKSSHKDSKVNDQFDKWLQENYGEHGEVAIHQGKKHDYLGMELDFSEKGKVKIGTTKYVASMLEVFPEKLKSTDTAVTPASDGLFNEGQGRSMKNVQMHITQWLQKHYFYVSVRDQTYSLRQRPEQSRLGKTSQTDEVPEWYEITQADTECRQSTLHQVVRGRKFCCPS
jgi:hypothetical protein